VAYHFLPGDHIIFTTTKSDSIYEIAYKL